MGNRSDHSSTASTGNQYSSFNGGQYFWSAESLLDSARLDSYAMVKYDYNARGKPVIKYRKVSGGSWAIDSYFIWDGDQLLLELDASGNRRADYVYYPGTIDQPAAETIGATSVTAIRDHRMDASGNVTGTVDGVAVSQKVSYDAWGTPTIAGNADNRLLWKGLMWEGDVDSLYYVRNRWYDPELGRFASEDPIGQAGGDNLYAFGNNDPVNASDPSGALQYDRYGAVCSIYAKCGEPLELGGVFLNGSSGAPASRGLTSEEKQKLGDICKAVNCDQVKVYFTELSRSATLGHLIFLGKDDWTDFSVLVHEMIHVTQYEKWGALEYLRQGLDARVQEFQGRDPYAYAFDGRSFDRYGMEQQGRIAQRCASGARAACWVLPYSLGH